ncbi:hypothetical protein K1T71_009106 [Dendrolimus kikuchii]|uniref:Uncharacterized protein n=1 Tax=Dendrolimus kikuchii TaxID=765133 RepID=A0ACC1CU55_9NEOP|nr:hypothetical protein K1T71_009106 [Dendrolimus kikuchii]
MADTMVERRPATRFFCHRCNIEFEDVLQVKINNCRSFSNLFATHGICETLVSDNGTPFISREMEDFLEANKIKHVTTAPYHPATNGLAERMGVAPMLNDLAFLMSGGRIRGAGRRETLMEQLVWMIGGARPGTGAVTAGAPFVLVGAPGDYVFGGEGLDAVVTQLLGQLENSGPPPLPRDQIASIPSVPVTEEQAAANTSCSICWENFLLGENVSRLECEHVFHSVCISPWLQLHATCPICRRSLLPEAPPAPPPGATTGPATGAPTPPTGGSPNAPPTGPLQNSVILRFPGNIRGRRFIRRRPTLVAEGWVLRDSGGSTSSTSVGSSTTSGSRSSTSADSEDCTSQYNMDIDFD